MCGASPSEANGGDGAAAARPLWTAKVKTEKELVSVIEAVRTEHADR